MMELRSAMQAADSSPSSPFARRKARDDTTMDTGGRWADPVQAAQAMLHGVTLERKPEGARQAFVRFSGERAQQRGSSGCLSSREHEVVTLRARAEKAEAIMDALYLAHRTREAVMNNTEAKATALNKRVEEADAVKRQADGLAKNREASQAAAREQERQKSDEQARTREQVVAEMEKIREEELTRVRDELGREREARQQVEQELREARQTLAAEREEHADVGKAAEVNRRDLAAALKREAELLQHVDSLKAEAALADQG